MAKILVVEDDVGVLEMLCSYLESQHHIIESAREGRQALDLLTTYEYDLVILDLNLPDMDGIEICQKYRAAGGAARTLMLTGRRSVEDKEQGFDVGADDYLTKPFDVRELNARIKALMRRSAEVTTDVLRIGEIEIDVSNHVICKNGAPVDLGRREFALLEFLMRNPNTVFSAEALLDRVWDSDVDSEETVKTCVYRIRAKLGLSDQPPTIVNIRGFGYKFLPG